MSLYGVIGYHVTLSEGHIIANHPIYSLSFRGSPFIAVVLLGRYPVQKYQVWQDHKRYIPVYTIQGRIQGGGGIMVCICKPPPEYSENVSFFLNYRMINL